MHGNPVTWRMTMEACLLRGAMFIARATICAVIRSHPCWLLQILPLPSLPLFISSHILFDSFFARSLKSVYLFTFHLPPSQFKSLLQNTGVICYFISFLTGHLYQIFLYSSNIPTHTFNL